MHSRWFRGWEDYKDTNVYEPVVLTNVRALIPGVLAIIGGCSEQSRREIAGPRISGQLLPYGHAADRDGGILDYDDRAREVGSYLEMDLMERAI